MINPRPAGPESAPLASADAPAIAVDDDRLIAYALAADPVFSGMRALIGQLSGMLILAQTRRWLEIPDRPDVAVVRGRRNEVAECLSVVKAPPEKERDFAQLVQALARVDEAIALVAELRLKNLDESIDGATAHLKAAYRLMQGACDHRLGLAMVDASGACCSCGVKLATRE